MRFDWKMIVAGVAVFGAVASLRAADGTPVSTGQHAQTFEKQVTVKLDYLLSIPADYNKDAKKKWPLILFLHGSGERGSDVNRVKIHGPPKIVDKEPESAVAKEFIVVSPQCPTGRWWKVDELSALLDDMEAKYSVDPDHIYVTGLSMGGFGTWDLASNFPDRFAAIAPMCGGGQIEMARRLKNLPIWVFHGEADPAVPFKRSEDMVDVLKKVGADVKFTRYPGVGHDCWTESYANPDLYAWFLSHKRGEKPTVESKSVKTPKAENKGPPVDAFLCIDDSKSREREDSREEMTFYPDFAALFADIPISGSFGKIFEPQRRKGRKDRKEMQLKVQNSLRPLRPLRPLRLCGSLRLSAEPTLSAFASSRSLTDSGERAGRQ